MPTMIQTKEDYNFFLEADQIALGARARRHPKIIGDDQWKYLRLLRKSEYYLNCRGDLFGRLYYQYLRYKIYKMGMKLGFYIPPNVCGPGFCTAQFLGPIIVNPYATLGANCVISTGVIIGGSPKSNYTHGTGFPKIGNHVFIGPYAVIVGPIEIADDIAIGANSYVSKSFLECGITIAGSPARKILETGNWIECATEVLKARKSKK